jgi:hypothetical protein
MGRRIAAAVLLSLAAMPGSALAAGDPIMPLSELRAGMQCTAYSVVRGTEPVSFGAEIEDVIDGDGTATGPRILVRTYGAAIDATGIGPGFSGSPIYCDSGDGRGPRSAGAISESIGEYGGKTVLATPIEQILGVPVDPPVAAASRDARARAAMHDARRLATPITVGGLSTSIATALAKAGAKNGHPVLAAPAAPLTPFPPVTLRPGSAVAAGLSTGDLTVGSIGTVSYVDGDRVWAFGHPLDDAGRRSLILQDAYVFKVINNPNQLGDFGSTYKLASGGHSLGTLTSDGDTAIAGRTGIAAPTIPIRVAVRDLDTKAGHVLNVAAADETDVASPTGVSAAGFIAPIAVVQALQTLLRAAPPKLAGQGCIVLAVRELPRPVRICNRYVGTGAEGVIPGVGTTVAARMAGDLADALSQVDAYSFAPPHITKIDVTLDVRRGIQQAFIQKVRLPARIRRGSTVQAKVTLRRARSKRSETRTYAFRVPRSLPSGPRRLTFVGEDADAPEGDLFGELTLTIGEEEDTGGDPGPTSIKQLASSLRAINRWDGVQVRAGRGRPARAFRDPALRLSGRAVAATVLR